MADMQNPVMPSTAAPPRERARPSWKVDTDRLSLVTLIFAALFVVFFLLLIFLRIPFALYPLMSWQDALDLLTPLVLIPLYWLMYRLMTVEGKNRAGDLIFAGFTALWAMGQGMHLSANSIDNLIENLAKSRVLDVVQTDVYRLAYFYDEELSHYLWHAGILGLALLLMFVSWRSQEALRVDWRLVAPACTLYGIACFCIFVEGQTTPLSFPVTVMAGLVPLIWGRPKLALQPVLVFFTISFLLAGVLIAGWSISHGQFPPPELLQ